MVTADDGKSLDGEDPLDPPPHAQIDNHLLSHAPPVIYSEGYPTLQMNMYSYPSHHFAPQALRSKRRQVKNACTNCQKACKKCDDARPCLRCVKYGISEECVDSQRKERKKGIKRGPYKKRDGKGSNINPNNGSPNGVPASINIHSPSPPYLPIGYPSSYYSQYPSVEKSGEAAALCSPSQYFLAALPHVHSQPNSTLADNDISSEGFYQTAIYTPTQHHQYSLSRVDFPHSLSSFIGHTMQKHNLFDGTGEIIQNGIRGSIQGHDVSTITDN